MQFSNAAFKGQLKLECKCGKQKGVGNIICTREFPFSAAKHRKLAQGSLNFLISLCMCVCRRGRIIKALTAKNYSKQSLFWFCKGLKKDSHL